METEARQSALIRLDLTVGIARVQPTDPQPVLELPTGWTTLPPAPNVPSDIARLGRRRRSVGSRDPRRPDRLRAYGSPRWAISPPPPNPASRPRSASTSSAPAAAAPPSSRNAPEPRRPAHRRRPARPRRRLRARLGRDRDHAREPRPRRPRGRPRPRFAARRRRDGVDADRPLPRPCRRRCCMALLVLMAIAGTVFALTGWLPALILAGLTGTVSADVVESGLFTSLEQAMLAHAEAD